MGQLAVQIEAAGALFRLNNDGDARSLLQSTVAGADADMAQRAKRTLAVTP